MFHSFALERINSALDAVEDGPDQESNIVESNNDELSDRTRSETGATYDQKEGLLVQNDKTEGNSPSDLPLVAELDIDAENEDNYGIGEQEVQRNVFRFGDLASKGIDADMTEEDLYEIDHIYLIPIMPKGASKIKRKPENSRFLAGLDFSTGVFDPNFQQGGGTFASASGTTFADARVESVNDQLTSFNATNKDFLLVRSAGQETKPEIAYSYGANFGFRISRRIILQSGIAYRKANTTTTTRGYFEDPVNNTQIPIVASYQYQLDGLSAVKRTAETDLNNQYEFASIPLRAGYVFLDRKVNLTLMAGVSSELFLHNRIGSNNSDFETLSTSSGEGSPYKRVYFNGSLGTMLGYTLAKNYLITVEPSYRFAVNSFTREDFYLNSYPSSFMVSFGVAYNFR